MEKKVLKEHINLWIEYSNTNTWRGRTRSASDPKIVPRYSLSDILINTLEKMIYIFATGFWAQIQIYLFKTYIQTKNPELHSWVNSYKLFSYSYLNTHLLEKIRRLEANQDASTHTWLLTLRYLSDISDE